MVASAEADTAAAPIVVSPSGSWDGNDGPWSTFDIHVGTPPQPVRVLVSTVAGWTAIVSANRTEGGCIGTDPPTCPQSRGELFNLNASSTWHDQGIYGLGIEVNLPDYQDDYDSGDFGFDALGLGLAGSSGARFDAQILAAIATKDYYLGFLGVNPNPTNITAFDEPQVSFLSSLKQSNNTPSLSYGYSAGAKYRSNQSFGSLTFGGYDASKFAPSNVSFQMASDIARDLAVQLDSIIFNDKSPTNKTLLSESIPVFVDSSIPHIWLPRESCTLFEDAFGITYNYTIERYLVNDTLHAQLQTQNASVSFVLSNDIPNEINKTVKIEFPYASFDLEIGPPYVDTTQKYFPLRRADNATQYTLGRMFLQESYLIADYERANFSISQSIWPEDTANAIPPPAQIVAIAPVNGTSGEATARGTTIGTTTGTTAGTTTAHPGLKISAGAITGIVMSAALLCIIAASTSFFSARKRRRRKRKADTKTEKDVDPFQKAEIDGNGIILVELDGLEKQVPEVDSSSKMEMQGSDVYLSVFDKQRTEIKGSNVSAELEGDALVAVDVYARPVELADFVTPNISSDGGLDAPLMRV